MWSVNDETGSNKQDNLRDPMMQRLWWILVLFVLAVTPRPAVSSDKSSFIVRDSGFQASSQHRIYWLDNDRVIFTGYEINLEKLDKQGRYGREQNIYIWDTRENRRSIYVKNASLGCYFRGYIAYSILEGPSKKGPIGQERKYLDLQYSKETWEGEPPEWEEGVKHHPITCKAYFSRGLRGDYVELLPEHGYLDVRRSRDIQSGKDAAILWHRPGTSDAVALPILKSEVDPSHIHYIAFLDSYFMYGWNNIAKREVVQPQAYWLMKPDGSVTKHEVLGYFGGWTKATPTQDGLFLITNAINVQKSLDPGDAGVYWVHQNQLQKISGGMIGSFTVSPDGCKVAFVRDPFNAKDREPRITLNLIDVCKGA